VVAVFFGGRRRRKNQSLVTMSGFRNVGLFLLVSKLFGVFLRRSLSSSSS
jgi:hypothetical protein